ncbi:LacI family transcriptional regulator [Verticiella sediminum]|uniref:LacI family transcriptional regulator n=1 Tax=Verticiella sediminum TaxID=1247510 RepID=A0A556A7E4_9BURK|nr:LacI family DNA-binding transcriptional regulator [Verticiella sediminum]TSH88792.1 LacI family transcriptional regulator [Verticiella sediminum]
MALTLRDVAQAAGVSVATASRALAGSGLINQATRTHVAQVAAAIGYRANPLARALKTRKSRLIGLTVHNLENTSFRTLAAVVQQRMQALGYQVILSISSDDAAQEREILATLLDHGIDGLISVPTGANGRQMTDLEQTGIPVISAVRHIDDAHLESVLAADFEGAYAGTRHLLELGHRRIGLIVGISETTSGKERLAGYTRALSEAGVALDPALIHQGRYAPETGVEGAEAVLGATPPPTALFVANHESSVGVLRVVADKGLRVPDDLSLLFYEDTPWFQWLSPPMSVVDSGASELANLAVERLLQRLDGAANSGREFRIGSRLVQRASCRAPKES